jgi:hypothetical protein
MLGTQAKPAGVNRAGFDFVNNNQRENHLGEMRSLAVRGLVVYSPAELRRDRRATKYAAPMVTSAGTTPAANSGPGAPLSSVPVPYPA